MSKGGGSGLLLTFARRGEDDLVMQAIARLKDEGAGEIVAVGTPVSTAVLRELGVDDIIPYGEGQGARNVIGELRRRRPQMAAIVYWDSGFAGHLKLEMLGLLSGAGHVWRVAPEAPAAAIGRAQLARTVVVKALLACGCAVAGTAICSVAFVCLLTRSARGRLAGGARASRV